MNLFDKLVVEALENQPNLAKLKEVVEKELLHHDILKILSDNGLLTDLTFIGGTCLRCCYGGVRLSEDLDFTGGQGFSRNSLVTMGDILVDSLQEKYELKVQVSEPEKDKLDVDTWKIKIVTRPESRNLPVQRINIDICAVPSYETRPAMLANYYGVDMGTSGLIIQAQSREEIYADKLLAVALRPNRVKNRDLWDITWLHGQGIKPRFSLIPAKLHDRGVAVDDFLRLFEERQNTLVQNREFAAEFQKEMSRFLPVDRVNASLVNGNLWLFTMHLLEDLDNQMRREIQK